MIPIWIGALVLIAIFGLFYFIRNTPTKCGNPVSKKEVLEDDIVLALLTESQTMENSYAILWNGTPGKKYSYVIAQDSLEVANGDITSATSVFKVKGIPLKQGITYDVMISSADSTTKVKIPFIPPLVTSATISGDYLAVETNIVPTNIEVSVASTKIPLSECHIKIEPPGFGCKLPNPGDSKPTTIIYNGPNAVNILI